jgi:hypothetical protein
MTNTTSGVASTDGFILRYNGLNAEFLNREAGNSIFYTSAAERMRIESGGALLVTSNDIKSSISGTYYLSGANGTAGSPTYVTYSFVDDANTGMYRVGADTLGFSTGGSERMRIDSSGNVLVGTTTTSVWDASAGDANDNGISLLDSGILGVSSYQATANSGFVSAVNRTGTDGNHIIFRKDGATVGSIGTRGGDTVIASTSQGVRFYDANNVLLPTDGVGAGLDATISLGQSDGRWKDLYLSGGVYLGGTGSANHLDDYEYGSFEPEFGGDVSDPTVTYDGTVGNEGWYVKAGRLVFIQINIRTDSVSGGSGAVVIRNLPFVTPNLSGQGGVGSFTIGYAENWGGERPIAGTISEGVTYINLSHRSAVDGDNITTNITDLGAGANANLIRLSGTYYTTA